MRRLGYNESPTANSPRYGLGSISSKLIALAFAVLFLLFFGTASALAESSLGEVTDPALDAAQTGDSDDSGLLKQVTEPVTDLVVPSGRESQDAPGEGDNQPSPADAKTTDSQPAEPASSQQPDSAVAATDTKSASQTSEPALPDDGDSNAPPADQAAGDEDAIEAVAEPVETAVRSADAADSAGEQPTGLTDAVSRVAEAPTGLIGRAGGPASDAVESLSDPADHLVGGAAHLAESSIAAVEIVNDVTKPLENSLPVISSSVERAEDLLEVTVELIATSVDEVVQSSVATFDELAATADHLVKSTAGVVEDRLAGSPAGNVVVGIAPDVAGQPETIETGAGPPPPKPVAPAIVDQPRSDTPRPAVVEHGARERSLSAPDAAPDARSIRSPTTPVNELLAMEVAQERYGSGSANRAGGTASSIPPAAARSSNAGPSSGLFLVLAAMGMLAPRLSRWFRLEPVLWRRHALAAAIDRPG